MLEIVFGDSALGGLRAAVGYREGCFVDVLILHEDGSAPTEDEIAEARRELEDRQRKERAESVPMEGDPGDFFGFSLNLSVGDISEDTPGPLRQAALEEQIDRNFPGTDGIALFLMEQARENLNTLRSRIAAGEPARIWYSDQPDEMCGLCWLLAQLADVGGSVYGVKLPPWQINPDGTLSTYTGWGDILPGKWAAFLPLTRELPEQARRYYTGIWRQLQEENAPLRAVVNGKLRSVPENLFDDDIRREIGKMGERFMEARLIGSVLGKYQPGVGDMWIHARIEAMVRTGELEAVPSTPKQDKVPYPVYHRELRRKI